MQEPSKTFDKSVDITLLNIGNEAETTVNSIMGFVQLFKSGTFHQMDQKEHFDGIAHSAEHFFELIDTFRDVIKLQYEQLDLTLTQIDGYPFFRNMFTKNTPHAVKRGIDFKLDLQPSVGTIVGDIKRLERLFKYLVYKTIMYTEKKRSAGITAKRINGHITATVWNTGAPYAEEIVNQLFLPIIYSGNTVHFETGMRIKGSGLLDSGKDGTGLLLAEEIIKLHGGKLSLDSKNSGQNSVAIVLPAE